jgi:arginine/lysine/ornithine decarboxylase
MTEDIFDASFSDASFFDANSHQTKNEKFANRYSLINSGSPSLPAAFCMGER